MHVCLIKSALSLLPYNSLHQLQLFLSKFIFFLSLFLSRPPSVPSSLPPVLLPSPPQSHQIQLVLPIGAWILDYLLETIPEENIICLHSSCQLSKAPQTAVNMVSSCSIYTRILVDLLLLWPNCLWVGLVQQCCLVQKILFVADITPSGF